MPEKEYNVPLTLYTDEEVASRQTDRKAKEIEDVAKYNIANGTHFWNIEQVRKDQLQKETEKSLSENRETVQNLRNQTGRTIIPTNEKVVEVNALQRVADETGDSALKQQAKQATANLAKETGIGMVSALTAPLVAGEFGTYGLWGGLARLLGGTATGAAGSFIGNGIGQLGDRAFGTSWMAPTGKIIGGFAGFAPGMNAATGLLRNAAGKGITMRMPQNTFMKLRGEWFDKTFSEIGNAKNNWITNITGSDGKIFNSKIVRNRNNYYRAVDEDAIIDANTSGLIRGAKVRGNDNFPFFARSQEPYTHRKYVIEGAPDSAEWISTYPYAYSKNPEIVKMPKFAERDYSLGYETPIGSKDINGYQLIGGFDSEFLKGYEALPMTKGNVNGSNASNFSYWKRYPLFGWRHKNFNIKAIPSEGKVWTIDPTKQTRVVSEGTYPLYTGPKQSSVSPQQAATTYHFDGRMPLSRPISEAERLGIPKGERSNLTQDQLEALDDLIQFNKSGKYKTQLYISDNGKIYWGKPNENQKMFLQEAAGSGLKADTYGTNGVQFRGHSPYYNGTVTVGYDEGPKMTAFSLDFPTEYGSATFSSTPHKTGTLILTSPRSDFYDPRGFGIENEALSAGESLPNTISKDLMKNYWKAADDLVQPGTYLSGDTGTYPIGVDAIRDIQDNKGMTSAISKILYPKLGKGHANGLSVDSFSSIIRQGQRPGKSLRWGDGFTKWNDSGVQNKEIFDAWTKMNKGEITPEQYKEIFDAWAIPLGGRPAQIRETSAFRTLTGNDGITRTIPQEQKKFVIMPHPYIFYRKQGGTLKTLKQDNKL